MLLRHLIEQRAVTTTLKSPADWLKDYLSGAATGGTVTDAGVTVNEETALRVIAVLSCVRLIAETCASLPLKLYKREGEKRVEIRPPRSKFLYERPNPEQTRQFFWETLFGHALLWGNAFIFKQRNEAGQVVELWPLRPDRVEVLRTTTGRKVFRLNRDPRAIYGTEDILHVPGFSTDGFTGLSPIGQARQAVGLALAAEEFGARFFGQGTQLGGVISVPGELDDDDATRLLMQWRKAHSGLAKAHEVAVLDSNASWQSVGIPPEDSQFIQTREFQVTEIARLYRVPPHLIGDMAKSTSWGSGLEEQNIMFVTLTLMPWLSRFEQAITDDLTAAEAHYAKFSVSGLLRGDTTARYNAYKVGRETGWLSINDIRRLEDLDPITIPGADDYLVPMNFTTIDALHAQAQQPPAQPGAPGAPGDANAPTDPAAPVVKTWETEPDYEPATPQTPDSQ